MQQHCHGQFSCSTFQADSHKLTSQFLQKHQLQLCTYSTKCNQNICLFYRDESSNIAFTKAYDRSTLYIIDIFVAENVRRQGLGTYFLYVVACEARKKRFHTIILDSILEAHNVFYKRLGFKYSQECGDNEMTIKTRDLIQNIEKINSSFALSLTK